MVLVYVLVRFFICSGKLSCMFAKRSSEGVKCPDNKSREKGIDLDSVIFLLTE